MLLSAVIRVFKVRMKPENRFSSASEIPGQSISRLRKSLLDRDATRVGSMVVTRAERTFRSMADSSPKESPATRSASATSSPSVRKSMALSLPLTTKKTLVDSSLRSTTISSAPYSSHSALFSSLAMIGGGASVRRVMFVRILTEGSNRFSLSATVWPSSFNAPRLLLAPKRTTPRYCGKDVVFSQAGSAQKKEKKIQFFVIVGGMGGYWGGVLPRLA